MTTHFQLPVSDESLPATYDKIDVSIVIPCLNEAQSISACINKSLEVLRTQKINGEVVVADNGSTDGSVQIAQACGVRVVLPPIRGYGSAVRKGIDEARGDFIIIGDADDTYDFSEVPGFVQKWREGYDFVLGNRF